MTNSGFMLVDEQTFPTRFPDLPFVIGHRLADHSLFNLPRLLALARALPPSCVEYNSGLLAVDQDPDSMPSNGLSVRETIARIGENSSWMVLKNVERDGQYARLLHACLDDIRQHSESLAPGMDVPEGYIFISSPHAITPFHIDPEHNFLAQVCGRKTVFVFDAQDRELLSERQLERLYGANARRNLPYREEFAGRARSFTLHPGQALYLPQNSPHWVRNEDAVSISFSATFRSALSEKRSRLYHMNNRLRAAGLQPYPVGLSPLRDTLKDFAFRGGSKAMAWLTGRPGLLEARY